MVLNGSGHHDSCDWRCSCRAARSRIFNVLRHCRPQFQSLWKTMCDHSLPMTQSAFTVEETEHVIGPHFNPITH